MTNLMCSSVCVRSNCTTEIEKWKFYLLRSRTSTCSILCVQCFERVYLFIEIENSNLFAQTNIWLFFFSLFISFVAMHARKDNTRILQLSSIKFIACSRTFCPSDAHHDSRWWKSFQINGKWIWAPNHLVSLTLNYCQSISISYRIAFPR